MEPKVIIMMRIKVTQNIIESAVDGLIDTLSQRVIMEVPIVGQGVMMAAEELGGVCAHSDQSD